MVRTDRLGGANNRLYYAGKHRHHGVNLQGLTDPYGRLIWISEGLTGSTHDLTAARHHQIFPTINRADLHLFADKGYLGGESTLLLLPYKGRRLPDGYRDANRTHAATRTRGEQGFATLKHWKILTRVRTCPRRVGPIAQAILTLEQQG